MYDTADTIAAITTPLGESGIGAIRISGPDAYAVGDKIFKSKSAVPLKERRDRSIQYGTIVDENGTCIDEVLALIMKGPHSYTAEDVLEIQCHGGREALESILQLILRSGARMANPGEFTERAFVNGRIDLAQAEAVMDVIQAKSRAGLTSAVSQLEGRLSKVINKTRKELTELVTRLEVMIDYPEEDLEDIAVPDVSGALQEMQEKLQHMLEESQNGRMIRDGVMAAIAGTPNAGKSSLLNRLLQEERAIVTDVPGTTRDVLEEWITLRGVPVCLVDTAGIRETDDTVEKIGVSRARRYLDQADIILAVIDGSRPLTDEDKDILQSAADKNVIIVLNKTDLPSVMTSQDLSTYGFPICPISASTGDGLEELKDRLLQEVLKGGFTDGPSALLTNTRHIELVRQSAEALERARQSLQDGMPLDCAVIDIRQAWDTLGSITGDTVHDDIVEEIFSRFCLGK
ncbi:MULTISPECIES: tRNA uridine-5-carboxymethylaminomethyl(34) synthesis GTPase MnmE [unclassified Megasphaera]|uniref:tRNA uridine-5-carboxymethylaminomethyl(34) synthesis GTPase MnmE n=1 Tax=unclassified Megasphaera TaxID=2626256 RepID=UPI00073F01E6|nr:MULTISPECIES: tRNA uridine-5-carboxymethylaminomethyl(34) synthesis GTPase MnmE [unclassified Megasphaera]KUH56517.1 tRNA modification GTPase MnmE [Megasphaera sp. DJF_B143]HAM04792.1 tRNA uridine-5-carboxymethylaminomethyl(34) synthesis GTPase MnmE [Megasphaera sp.]